MRSAIRFGGAAAAAGLLAVCCALGPAAVVAGVGIVLGGFGLGAWSLAAGGLIAGASVLLVVLDRRHGSRAACEPRRRIASIGRDG